MKTLVLNLYAGPGTGKSTTAAAVFAEFKYRGLLCEMALEFAKDLTWEKSRHVLANQMYVFGHQHHRITRLVGQVPIIISDSPLLHSIVYDSGENPYFAPMVVAEHKKLHNLNVFLERVKEYDPKGRSQTLEEAKGLDNRIYELLFTLAQEDTRETLCNYPASREGARSIAELAWNSWVELNTDFQGTAISPEVEEILKKQDV